MASTVPSVCLNVGPVMPQCASTGAGAMRKDSTLSWLLKKRRKDAVLFSIVPIEPAHKIDTDTVPMLT